jgi:hypothetical protein
MPCAYRGGPIAQTCNKTRQRNVYGCAVAGISDDLGIHVLVIHGHVFAVKHMVKDESIDLGIRMYGNGYVIVRNSYDRRCLALLNVYRQT